MGGGPHHPLRDDGSTVDATFELAVMPVYEVVYHHKAGGQRAINSDYHEGLELLLARIGQVGGAILGVSVDSGVAKDLAPADRELALTFPIEVDQRTDAHELRLQITRAVRSIARRPDAKPGGGNDQKRIRIIVALDRPLGVEAMRELLVGG